MPISCTIILVISVGYSVPELLWSCFMQVYGFSWCVLAAIVLTFKVSIFNHSHLYLLRKTIQIFGLRVSMIQDKPLIFNLSAILKIWSVQLYLSCIVLSNVGKQPLSTIWIFDIPCSSRKAKPLNHICML